MINSTSLILFKKLSAIEFVYFVQDYPFYYETYSNTSAILDENTILILTTAKVIIHLKSSEYIPLFSLSFGLKIEKAGFPGSQYALFLMMFS